MVSDFVKHWRIRKFKFYEFMAISKSISSYFSERAGKGDGGKFRTRLKSIVCYSCDHTIPIRARSHARNCDVSGICFTVVGWSYNFADIVFGNTIPYASGFPGVADGGAERLDVRGDDENQQRKRVQNLFHKRWVLCFGKSLPEVGLRLLFVLVSFSVVGFAPFPSMGGGLRCESLSVVGTDRPAWVTDSAKILQKVSAEGLFCKIQIRKTDRILESGQLRKSDYVGTQRCSQYCPLRCRSVEIFLYSPALSPVVFLKAVLKALRELNPTDSAMA